MPKTIIVLFSCGTLLLGCSKKTPNYSPITDSSRWEYTLEFSSPCLGFQRGKGVVRMDGHETINGMDYSKLVTVVTGIPSYEPFTLYRRYTTDAVYEIPTKPIGDPSQEDISLLLPPTVGKKWQTETPDAHTEWKIEAIETAELIDRKYEGCLKVSYRRTYKNGSNPKTTVGYQYLAPGVGNVKEHFQQGDSLFTFTLDKHTK